MVLNSDFSPKILLPKMVQIINMLLVSHLKYYKSIV